LTIETRPGPRALWETLELLGGRLDRGLRRAPRLQQTVLALRRRVHVARFEARLRAAARHPNDPYIDVLRMIDVPVSQLRRHTVALDYYPTADPCAALPGTWDVDAWVIDERKYYTELREAVQGTRPWNTTEFYDSLVAPALAERRRWRREELLAYAHDRMRRYEKMYASMKQHGYLTQARLTELRPAGYEPLQFDEISIGVARDGELQLCQGGHRFAIAKAAGIEVLPVWIALRHTEWCEFRRVLAAAAAAHGGRVPEPLLHPDLATIPFDPEPTVTLDRTLGLLPVLPARIIDISPGWGYVAHRCEDLGYDCTVVPDGPEDRALTERLRVASGKTFQVAADLAETTSMATRPDIVLGLRGVDRRLATDTGRDELAAFFAACRPSLVVLSGSSEAARFCAAAADLSSIASVPGEGPKLHAVT
jgi:hypothetical protein